MRRFTVCVAVLALSVLAGCSSSESDGETSASPSPAVSVPNDGVDRSKTIEDEGQQFTCGQALKRPDEICEKNIQLAFNQWADKAIDFVNDPIMDTEPWASASFADVAMAGLVACDFASVDNAFGFTQYMKGYRDGQYSNETAVSNLYLGATVIMCP